MAIFKVKARDGSVDLIVRARCMSCARKLACEKTPAAEFNLWVSADVEVVYNPGHHGYLADGRHGIIERIKHGKD